VLCYVELIRGTPMVAQVMLIYFALPIILHTRIEALHAAILAIALNSGAYLSELVRGALLSINKGLREAGLAMGLPFYKVLAHVIGSSAFRRLIPPLGNQCMTSLKDTSIFIVIGVGELTRQGQEVIAGNFRFVEVWSAVAVFYLAMTGAITLCLIERMMRILEHRENRRRYQTLWLPDGAPGHQSDHQRRRGRGRGWAFRLRKIDALALHQRSRGNQRRRHFC